MKVEKGKVNKEVETLLSNIIEKYQNRGECIPKLTHDHNIFNECGLNMPIDDLDKYVKKIGVPPCFQKDENYIENLEKLVLKRIEKDEERKKYKFSLQENIIKQEEIIQAPKEEKVPKISFFELQRNIKNNLNKNNDLKAMINVLLKKSVNHYENEIEKKLERYIKSPNENEIPKLQMNPSTSSLVERGSNKSKACTRTSSMGDIKKNRILKSSNAKRPIILKCPKFEIPNSKDANDFIDEAKTTKSTWNANKTGEGFNSTKSKFNNTGEQFNKTNSVFNSTNEQFHKKHVIFEKTKEENKEEQEGKNKELKKYSSMLHIKHNNNFIIKENNKEDTTKSLISLSPKSIHSTPELNKQTQEENNKSRKTIFFKTKYPKKKNYYKEKNKAKLESDRITKLKQKKSTFLQYLYERLNNREYNNEVKQEIQDYFVEFWRITPEQLQNYIKRVQANDLLKGISDVKMTTNQFDIPEVYKLFASNYGTLYGGFDLKNSLLKEVS